MRRGSGCGEKLKVEDEMWGRGLILKEERRQIGR